MEEAGKLPDIMIYHAGTRIENRIVYTNGGRLLGVTALGTSLKDARELAYEAVSRIKFDGMYFRKDIALDAIHT